MSGSSGVLRRVAWVSLCALVAVGNVVNAAEGAGKKPLTVAASLEMRRVLTAGMLTSEGLSISPDGKRFAIRLVRDDLERNGSWLELIAGRTDSLDAAAEAQTVVTLFTTSERDNDTGRLSPIHPGQAELTWLADNERVAFHWNDGKSPTQLLVVNVRTGQMENLTRHPTSIYRYALSSSNDRILYAATYGRPPEYKAHMASLVREGFAMSSTDALNTLFHGDYSGVSPWTNIELYIAAARDGQARKVSCEVLLCTRYSIAASFQGARMFSPDERYALLINAPIAKLSRSWSRYTDSRMRAALEGNDLESIHQIGILDLEQATVRPLLDVPSGWWLRSDFVWSPDSRRVLIGPTFLPLDTADAAGLAGKAVAEVDVATGRTWIVPVPREHLGTMVPKRWAKDGAIELSDGTTRLHYRKSRNQWRVVEAPREDTSVIAQTPVRIELRQGLNTPPALYAVESASGRERLILDVEPRLSTDYTLGRVESVEWKDSKGTSWKGRVYFPADYSPGVRYPMVIQLVGLLRASEEFSLFGHGDFAATAFAAQALANRNMAVLVPYRPADMALVTTDEADHIVRGLESAAEHFVSIGLARRERIGLVGYSRTGWYTEYALTQSSYPFAAAIASDNIDSSYTQAVLRYGMAGDFSMTKGAVPFGEGLQTWFRKAPGFNADKVRAPLRLETVTGGPLASLMHWEMYSRLSNLQKPVELVLVPESNKGEHPAQIPSQKRFSQEGTVDWMDFWLNGREDADPRKTAQYERWRKLRAQQEAQIAARRAAGEQVADLPPLQPASFTSVGENALH